MKERNMFFDMITLQHLDVRGVLLWVWSVAITFGMFYKHRQLDSIDKIKYSR